MSRRHAKGRASLAFVAMAVALVAPASVAAQEVGEDAPAEDAGDREPGEVGEEHRDEDGAGDTAAAAFELTGERLPVPDDAVQDGAQGILVWSEGRRAYHLVSRPGGSGMYNGAVLAAYDLDTLREVDRATIAAPGTVFYGYQFNRSAAGLMAVDRRDGRLFVPYMAETVTGCVGFDHPCLEGIYVVDARTLEVVGDLPFQPIGDDGVAAKPALRAMSYGEDDAGGGRLLVLVDAQVMPPTGGNDGNQRRTLAYAMQIDPADGSVDWVVQASACTHADQQPGRGAVGGERNVIFRTELPERSPEIYVGCYGSGGTGVVVRLTLDPDDVTAPPTAQEGYQGPGPVTDMLADAPTGRVLLRATPGTGDSLVVFDGARSNFVGALGVGAETASATAAGSDPMSGRLYVMATDSAPGGGRGESRFLAGTVRGEALPQLTPVPQLADTVADHFDSGGIFGHDYPIAVDPGEDGRPTRVLIRPGNGDGAADFYHVVEDRRPLGSAAGGELIRDVPSTDDVPLVDGATEASFTGAARGYGFRALLVGGIEAVPPVSQRGTTDNLLNADTGERVDGLVRGLVENSLTSQFVPPGTYPGIGQTSSPDLKRCIARDREFAFGLSGALDVLPDLGPTGAAAQAVGAATDAQTVADLAAPTQCGEGMVRVVSGLLAGAGVREPGQVDGLGVPLVFAEASCVAPGEQTRDEQGSEITPVSTSYAAVTCEEGRRTTGTGRARFVDLGPVAVGEASSTFTIERESGAGLVATVRSIARDVTIAGVVHIDAVEATAVSWATGRSQPEETLEDGFNCAEGRTAGTCLRRTLRGVAVGDFRCAECRPTDEQMVEAMQRALGNGWRVTVGEPDAFLARGTDNGALAGLLKSPDQQFSDSALNSDILPTLPTLELVRINDDGQGRARQVYQFAGIEASTSFGILCLLEVIDGECTHRPGALSLELVDLEGVPLAGGVFELYRDLDAGADQEPDDHDPEPTPTPTATDAPSPDPSPSATETGPGADRDDDPSPTPTAGAPSPEPTPSEEPSPGPSSRDPVEDGVVADPAADGSLVDPLVDELVEDGVCTTGTDGHGDCRFEGLAPGDYIIRQTAAPAGFLAAPDFPVTIGSGHDLTATFTNVSAVGRVDISLTDDGGAPLADGAFTLAADGADGGASGSCTTAEDGTCAITVALPEGPAEFVLSQTAAPDGFAPAPDTPLTLGPGETFAFAFTNVRPLGGAITIGLVDDLTDAPLGGGRFEVHADDGDGLLADGDALVATCTTGAEGACRYDPVAVAAARLGRDGPLASSGSTLTVPLGAYVVHQAAAPAGYAPADDLAFAFDTPGQTAAITVRNGTAGGSGQVADGAMSSPPPVAAGPTSIDVPAPQVAPTSAGIGGPTMQQVLQAPADLARLILRDPVQALAFVGIWLVFGAAALAIHRRLMLADALAP